MPYEWNKDSSENKFFSDKKHKNQIHNLEMICSMPEKGWQDIVLNLNRKLTMLDEKYKIVQIKEKFGILRFYFESHIRYVSSKQAMNRYVAEAEKASAYVCEKCGDPGVLIKQEFWRKTLCNICDQRWRKGDLYGRNTPYS